VGLRREKAALFQWVQAPPGNRCSRIGLLHQLRRTYTGQKPTYPSYHNEPAIAMKLLYDLFPVLLFFVAFKFQGIYVATAVAIAATIVQVIWAKYRHGKVDMMLWLSFVVVGMFGGATLLLHDESFIKWKPTVLFWLSSAIMLFSNLLFHKNLMHTLLNEKIVLPVHAWNRLNLSWSLFFVVLGFINLYVAFNYSTDSWVDFKLFGITGLMLLFILAQGVWMAKYVDKK
jgi:intracellular septation protein